MTAKRKEILIALVTAWICFIFLRSVKPGSVSAQESRWVLEMIQAIFPFDISVRLVRKMAHFAEFAVLGLLCWTLFAGRSARLWKKCVIFLLMIAFVALCDETIQIFIPDRASDVRDVWLDIFGAIFGAAAAMTLLFVRKKIKQKKDKTSLS